MTAFCCQGTDYLPFTEVFFIFIKSHLVLSEMYNVLKSLWKDRKLSFHGSAEKYQDHHTFKKLLDACYRTEWIPHCKRLSMVPNR